MKVIGVIPARLKSTRLPKKVLRQVAGKTLIEHVYQNAKRAEGLDDLIVACDSAEVMHVVENMGGKAVLTSERHKSGTERLVEIGEKVDCDVIINIQGDEPLLSPLNIDMLVDYFRKEEGVPVATIAVLKDSEEEFRNPNVVKVVKDNAGMALYFSRSPVPSAFEGKVKFLKHLGIYGYNRNFLTKVFPNLGETEIEKSEKLEQLRILGNGYKIKIIVSLYDSVGVDTKEDLKAVEKTLMKG